ncbi:hypothetical protein SERLA73DRAFT_175214 [Serpula lacrymans var. lacrymans S7.3]|uniref:Uncharacterized protein n=2 Tax=Serpula lacrymans var. lacrymans TaxID=341189 RepID=F8PL14_SERL3|nr:uncharacterized protein SERLADRAFT_457365 [Serpula lacrymans var. lacrymans S7.9]EGO03658.1 hypothetical protein SERLA73DRAFT_175214 [Serpula lacrymans var. lacrymans S7.3]EGO29524.1 hypothetical protein SERLADRAFT_457365 [Serpula lacrymans var. lacrymans S7.9]
MDSLDIVKQFVLATDTTWLARLDEGGLGGLQLLYDMQLVVCRCNMRKRRSCDRGGT